MKYKVKEYRLKAGMTQEELSVKSGVNRTTISALENGNEVNVSVKILKKISECLQVPVSDIFCWFCC